jgi:hypothetical protein
VRSFSLVGSLGQAATILHPWNEELVGEDGVVGAADWPGLERKLRPVLARL